jgi:hypothetical protein
LEVKIQVVQLRRVLLLFALVLGLSALVAAIAPSPSNRDEGDDAPPAVETPDEPAVERPVTRPVRLSEPVEGRRIPVERVSSDTRLTLEVQVSRPGDVELEGLGLRQSADPLAPVRFELLARPDGRYGVRFLPVRGAPELLGTLVFNPTATVRRRARER